MKFLAAYMAIALLTFGHSASNQEDCRPKGYRTDVEIKECIAMFALMGGSLWPVYWTWTAFDALKEPTQ